MGILPAIGNTTYSTILPGMSENFYRNFRALGRFIGFQCVRRVELNRERSRVEGGFLLALNHLGNLDPFVMSSLYSRPIDWMARIEFYRVKIFAWYLDRVNAICVDRHGVPARAIREGILRAKKGRVVGIFPEGGVSVAKISVLTGGQMKRGTATMALESGAGSLRPAAISASLSEPRNRCGRPPLS